MKITIKTLQQKQYIYEVSLDDTVLSLKDKIEASEKIERLKQTLIFKGKKLEDDHTLGSYEIKESDFVVLMISKPKTSSSASTSSATSEAALPPANVSAPPPPTLPVVASSESSKPSSEATNITNPSALVTGAEYESIILNLIEMGFEREQIVKALRAAYNNPDRAAEYLFSGNIPNVREDQGSTAPSSNLPPLATTQPPNRTSAVPNLFAGVPPSHPSTINNLQFLRNDPQFQQLMSICRQHPDFLQVLLQQIGVNNPRLLQAINENPQEFYQLLSEGGHTESEVSEFEEEEATAEEDVDLSNMDPAQLQQFISQYSTTTTGGNPGQPVVSGAPQTQFIQVSQEEKDAIDRLVGLGFERAKAIEAYFACDKDETLAANYLFDHINDEDL